MREKAHLGEGFRADHGADRGGLRGVEHLHRIVGRQIGVDRFLLGNVDALHRVGEDEAVDADHDRHRQFLGEPERLDMQIDRFLVGFGEQLHPAGVAHRHGVGMVVPDVDRRADRAVAERHHDRQAEAGRVVDGFGHEQQTLRGRRRVGARAGRRGADRHRQRGEFALDIDEFAIHEIAVAHQIAEALDDVGLRRDRIGADDFGAAQRDGLGHGVGAFDLLQHIGFLTLR